MKPRNPRPLTKNTVYYETKRLIPNIHFRYTGPKEPYYSDCHLYRPPPFQHTPDCLLCSDKPEDFDALERFLNP